jgi:hypothetical protein
LAQIAQCTSPDGDLAGVAFACEAFDGGFDLRPPVPILRVDLSLPTALVFRRTFGLGSTLGGGQLLIERLCS